MAFLQREQRPGDTDGEAAEVQRVAGVSPGRTGCSSWPRCGRLRRCGYTGLPIAPVVSTGTTARRSPEFMHAHALPESLGDQWQFWGPLRETTRLAEPTAGHLALAEWQQRRVREGAEVTLVTANVDNLHERAGSDPVHHITAGWARVSAWCRTAPAASTTTAQPTADPDALSGVQCSDAAGAVLSASGGRRRPSGRRSARCAAATRSSRWAPPAPSPRSAACCATPTSRGPHQSLVDPAPVSAGFDERLRMTADAALPLILAPAWACPPTASRQVLESRAWRPAPRGCRRTKRVVPARRRVLVMRARPCRVGTPLIRRPHRELNTTKSI